MIGRSRQVLAICYRHHLFSLPADSEDPKISVVYAISYIIGPFQIEQGTEARLKVYRQVAYKRYQVSAVLLRGVGVSVTYG